MDSIVLGIVEGLTEFLPVSSTGHLILTSHLLKLQSSGAFEMIIQAGAIFAVIWHYRSSFFASIKPALTFKGPSFDAWLKVFIAFVPAAIVGLLFAKVIKAYLFGVGPVVGALVIGGIAMIIIERLLPNTRDKNAPEEALDIETLGAMLSYKQALGIGIFQCFALWPGTSRSMSTILGGRILGLNTRQATEFSFWLAIPTLLAASAYDLFKHSSEFLGSASLAPLLVGIVVSFVSALIVIRIFLGFVKKHSLEVFGWYRIAIGALLYFFLI